MVRIAAIVSLSALLLLLSFSARLLESAQPSPHAACATQTSSISSPLSVVDAVDSKNVWILGQNGVLLRTANSGRSWNALIVNDHAAYLAAASENVAWVVGNSGLIEQTQDGGQNWSPQDSGTLANLVAITLVSPTVLWAVGDGGTIIRSDNGGTSWAAQTSGTSALLLDLDAVDASTAWVVGRQGTILKTSNGGTSWVSQYGLTSSPINDVDAVDANTAWAVGSGSALLLKTTNGGATWASVTPFGGANVSLQGIVAASKDVAWVVGEPGIFIETNDGGATWHSMPCEVAEFLSSVDRVDKGLWAVGSGGIILFSATQAPPGLDK